MDASRPVYGSYDGSVNLHNSGVTYPSYSDKLDEETSEMGFSPFPDYAKVKKKHVHENTDPYCNIEIGSLISGADDKPPPLPPRMSSDDDNDRTVLPSNESSESNVNQPLTIPASQVETKDIKSVETESTKNNENIKQDDYIAQTPAGNVPAPPPPPPMFGMLSSMLPPKDVVIPNCKMKPLFWNKVPDMLVQNSIWKDAEDRMDQFSTEKLETLFHLGNQQNVVEQEDKVAALAEEKATSKSILDPKKAQNLGIFLSVFKLGDTDIEAKLCALDETDGLSSEQIVALRRFKPSVEEFEMYKSYKGDTKKMINIDKFMLKLCKIPELNIRLDILLTVRELPDEFNGIEAPITNLMNACESLNANNNFIRLLEYVLSVGNYVNGGTNRGGAYGFKLSALVKLVDIRSTDKKHTLLEYIAEELYEKDLDALMCYKEMNSLLLPMDASLKGLIAEVEIMKKDVESVAKNIERHSNVLTEEFVNNTLEFVAIYSGKVAGLERQCQQVTGLTSLLKERFGENPSSDFGIWINHVADFIKQLQRAVENMEQKHWRISQTRAGIL